MAVFAWCSNEDLRIARIFPEYMACGTTFGVTKEQRKRFVADNIYGDNKLFTAIRCFMTSKEIKAHHWVMRTTLRHIIIDATLSFNQRIVCDQETSIYQPLRAIIANIPFVYKSRNRLDKYHLLTQRWNAKVIVSVSGLETNTILFFSYQCYHLFLITQRVKIK